jgi:hypothetical protein
MLLSPMANRISQPLGLSPGEILGAVLDRMYDGPQAWLVRRNVLIGCVALVPTFLEVILFLSLPVARLLAATWISDGIGLTDAIIGLFLPVVGFPYFAAFLFLLACIYLWLLLRSQEIPPRVKKRTAIFVMGAQLLLFATDGLIYLQNRPGGFRL